MKTPPVTYFIKKAVGLKIGKKPASGSKNPGKDVAGRITQAQIREIAEKKMKDLNANDIESAMTMIAGSARSMGIQVEG
jgi:large subunit ribosomal protein L11